ncbi:hypothetical protein PBY51_014639 [Eleginops maclovinus]|uniref:Centrosomal protein of 68 kDa n=1 Tax=Eleginops maclovinus TaxID=56733 RepID=A0AAN8AFP7_ELEMC|nr:hypothetical protein PBY51_014639 [Eleginops maclovinus]
MEAKGCSQRWGVLLPECEQSRRCSRPSSQQTRVAVAADRQYVKSTPLFSAQQHPSILKKHTDQENPLAVSRTEDQQQLTDRTSCTRVKEKLSPNSFSRSYRDMSPPSLWRRDLASPLVVSELRDRQSPPPGSRSTQLSLSRSNLEVQRLNPPVRPQLTSAVLHPTYSPRSRESRMNWGGDKLSPSGGYPVSPFQAEYWACAIPQALPPSPDRQTVSWDPNREYQALLDYSYPLRAVQPLCEGDTPKLQEHTLNPQDSGIEQDLLCSSSSLSLSGGYRSPSLQGLKASGTLLSLADLYCSPNQQCALSRCAFEELDEDFCPLPEQLEGLQLLPRQVREVTASWESVQWGGSNFSPVTPPDTQEVQQYTQEEEKRAAADHRDSKVRSPSGAWVEPARGGGGACPSSVRGLPGSQEKQEDPSDSLMHQIQVFCWQLEQLIKQLHEVSEQKELQTVSTVDIAGVKSSLAEYQRAVSVQQSATSSVLHSGQLLLRCIDNMSPFLKETLQLIKSHCGALESRTQLLLCSILSAMDSLSHQNQQNTQIKVEEAASSLS